MYALAFPAPAARARSHPPRADFSICTRRAAASRRPAPQPFNLFNLFRNLAHRSGRAARDGRWPRGTLPDSESALGLLAGRASVRRAGG
eukprot:7073804-Alexandrium_andersonii.AAC.1